MVIEKPQLFLERRDFLIFIFVMLFFMAIRLFVLYSAYQIFISKPFYYTTVNVLNAYPKTKNGKTYTVLKVHNDEGLTFFTSTHSGKNFRDKVLRLQIYPNSKITFGEYLGYFYVKSRIKKIYPSVMTVKQKLLAYVASQHTDANLSSLYQAIFFATPLDREFRKKIAGLGISHLVALSGFHLGILWAVLYGLLLLFYRPLQKRYFPYRYQLLDIGLAVVILLGWYVWFVDFPPSLVRSYAMVLVGWIVILLGIELLSFTFLTTVTVILLLLFPSLLVSLGFWLSIAGVFYIFLLLKHTEGSAKWKLSMLYIPLGIFLLMLPLVHGVFGLTTPCQLLSPLLSLLFIVFYPLAILLHVLGMGGLLDGGLAWLFSMPSEGTEKLLPLWAIAVYGGLSLWAIWSRWIFWFLLGLAVGYGGYLFLG